MASNHALLLGKLIGNLQSLEIGIRVFLHRCSDSSSHQTPTRSHYNLKVGDEVPEDAFTNYDSLGDLIKKYNSIIQSKDPNLVIDISVVQIRDLVAHGRVSAPEPDETKLEIVKFGKPSNGKVIVADCATMTDQWLQEKIDFVRSQLEIVAKAP